MLQKCEGEQAEQEHNISNPKQQYFIELALLETSVQAFLYKFKILIFNSFYTRLFCKI